MRTPVEPENVPFNLVGFEEDNAENFQIEMLRYGEDLLAEELELDREELLANLSSGAHKLNFVKIKLGSTELAALVDSGAARSFISLPVREQVTRMGFKVKKNKPATVLSPLGIREVVDEEIKLSISIHAHSQKINFRVLPSMGMPCILGIDALRAFGLSVYFREKVDIYNFDTDPTKCYKVFRGKIRNHFCDRGLCRI